MQAKNYNIPLWTVKLLKYNQLKKQQTNLIDKE